MKRYYAFFHVFFLMEITKTEKKSHVFAVAPHAGVWIEMMMTIYLPIILCVAPHAGVWIEIKNIVGVSPSAGVAPHAGVWIEMLNTALLLVF